MRTLIIYASHQGHTDRIARRISDRIVARGIPNDLVNVVEQPADRIVFDAYDAVVLGSAVHKGHCDSVIRSCIEKNRSFLCEVPTAFFSVSSGKHHKDRVEAGGLADEFLDELRWKPSTKVSFGGALRYSRFRSLEQKLMRWILKESGTETDLHDDLESTDWDIVDDFVAQFANVVDCCKQPKPNRPTFSFPIKRTREYAVQRRMASRHGGAHEEAVNSLQRNTSTFSSARPWSDENVIEKGKSGEFWNSSGFTVQQAARPV